jgi:hypothetical protein
MAILRLCWSWLQDGFFDRDNNLSQAMERRWWCSGCRIVGQVGVGDSCGWKLVRLLVQGCIDWIGLSRWCDGLT